MTSRPRYEFHAEAGFTLVEILMVLALVGILSVAGISMLTGSTDEVRYDATVAELRQVRSALVGDPDAKQGGNRASFGYLGDLGALPSTLDALVNKPSTLPTFTINPTARFGIGWNGPYLSTGAIGGPFSFKDKWGRNYTYAQGPPATITSLGADGVAGGTGINQDIVMNIPRDAQFATVYGFLSNGGSAYNNTFQAEINYPNGSGGLAQSLLTIPAGSQGAFQFTNIPFGPRSATIYVPSKAAATKIIGPVAFVVDRPSFLLPTNIFDLNPGGGGSGAGGDTSAGCTSNSGKVVNANLFAVSSGTQLYFYVNANQAVTLTKVRVDVPNNAAVTDVLLDGYRFRCGGSRTISPCPGSDSLDLTLNPSYYFYGAYRYVVLVFSSSVDSVTNMTMDFTHSGGCDRINVSGIY